MCKYTRWDRFSQTMWKSWKTICISPFLILLDIIRSVNYYHTSYVWIIIKTVTTFAFRSILNFYSFFFCVWSPKLCGHYDYIVFSKWLAQDHLSRPPLGQRVRERLLFGMAFFFLELNVVENISRVKSIINRNRSCFRRHVVKNKYFLYKMS